MPAVVAHQELAEEIDGQTTDLRCIVQFYAANGTSNEIAHADVLRASSRAKPIASPRSVRPSSRRGLMEQRLAPIEEALRLACEGEIADGPSAGGAVL
jgi:hypothetical protein